MAAIVMGRYQLAETFEDGLVQLYDLHDDPDEEHDLGAKMIGGYP
jgi:hypothetical protein